MDRFQKPWYVVKKGSVSDTMVSNAEWVNFRHHGI